MYWRLLLIMWLMIASFPTASRAEGHGFFRASRGPWIVYRYPLFREGNRPPEARRYSQTEYWPYDAYNRYPKFYGGFHARYFEELGRPSGDLGLRGTAW
jgi:hypothetical protein